MTSVKSLQEKYPAIYARDGGEKLTLGEVVARVGRALDAGASRKSAHAIACDVIDRDLLFGAWGWRWDERDWLMLRDLRGAIIAAYKLGKVNGQSQDRGQTK